MKKRDLIIDGVLLIAYLLAANPALTGISVHEWLGSAAVVVFFAHTALHMGTIMTAVRKGSSRAHRGPRLARLLLNVALLIALVLCAVSGLFVSATVLPSLGFLATDGYYLWDPLHALSAKVLLALILVHGAVNVEKVTGTVARLRAQSTASAANASSALEADLGEEVLS